MLAAMATPQRSIRHTIVTSFFVFLPLLGLVILIAITAAAWIELYRPAERAAAAGPLTQAQGTEIKEDVKGYLESVIAIAGLFSIAQTILAAFTSKSFADQAEKDVEKLDRLKEQYVLWAQAEDARDSALRSLVERVRPPGNLAPGAVNDSFDSVGWVDYRADLYGQMSVDERQLLLSTDRYLGYDLLPQLRSQGSAGVLRLLANFYLTKYDHEVRLGCAEWQDLERAHHLLQAWISRDPGAFQFHNDLAVVFTHYASYFEDRGDRENWRKALVTADEELKTSAKLQPAQQRSYYGRSVFAHDVAMKSARDQDKRPGIREAIQFLRQAKSKDNWETRPKPTMVTDMQYNLACYEALLASLPNDGGKIVLTGRAVDTVMGLLREVAEAGTIRKKFVDYDFDDPKGDMYRFHWELNPRHLTDLEKLRPRLSQRAAQDSPVLF
jgi:hypothetical protein